MSESLRVCDLTFVLRRSARRRTIGITVDRQGELILNAPIDCPSSALERVVLGRSLWIYTKLAEKEKLFQTGSNKQYVSGEGFHYLGRNYRLLLSTTPEKTVKALQLLRGRFILRREERHRAEQHFTRWYIEHGQAWLPQRVFLYANRIGVSPSEVNVRNLGYRWGSCSRAKGKINFNYQIMRLPPRIIDYIIVHELVHLLIPQHDQSFWQQVRFVFPDYNRRRQWLAKEGAHYR